MLPAPPAPSLPPPAAADADADDTLGVVLHEHATTRSRSAMALQVFDGTLMATVAVAAHSKPWIFLAFAGACIAMHGVWSLADVQATDPEATSTSVTRVGWRVLRGAAALAGIASAFALILSVFGLTFGTWIS
jgi:hypothetical protein